MPIRKASCAVALLTALLSSHSATAETTLRIAMTASDIPTATGLPNNGFEGMRFLGYPIFEGLVLWDLTQNRPTGGLASRARGEMGAGPRLTTRPGFSICAGASNSTTAPISMPTP